MTRKDVPVEPPLAYIHRGALQCLPGRFLAEPPDSLSRLHSLSNLRSVRLHCASGEKRHTSQNASHPLQPSTGAEPTRDSGASEPWDTDASIPAGALTPAQDSRLRGSSISTVTGIGDCASQVARLFIRLGRVPVY